MEERLCSFYVSILSKCHLRFGVFNVVYTVVRILQSHTEELGCVHDETPSQCLIAAFSLAASLSVVKASHRKKPVALPLCVPWWWGQMHYIVHLHSYLCHLSAHSWHVSRPEAILVWMQRLSQCLATVSVSVGSTTLLPLSLNLGCSSASTTATTLLGSLHFPAQLVILTI